MSIITLTMNCIGDMFYVTDVGAVVQVTRGRERRRGTKLKGGKGAREPQQGWIRSPLVGARAQGTGFGGVAVQVQGRCWCSTEGDTCGGREGEGF